MWGAGGLVHPRTSIGGGARWLAVHEVDDKLHFIMKSIHEQCVKYGTQPDGTIDYVKGANIAGCMKVATAMLEQGTI